jgi:hypothetical protein
MTRPGSRKDWRAIGANWRTEDALRQLPPKGVATGAPHHRSKSDWRRKGAR